MINNNPLLDKEFLKALYEHREKEVYAKVIALTMNEEPVEEIQGRVTSGSVNIDGSSAVRRTCSLSLVAQEMNINDFYWGLNTKFKLEVGLKVPDSVKNINQTIMKDGVHTAIFPYKDYDNIIWFPQGTYLISSFNISQSVNNYTINIQGKDKMCLLNGEISGSFFASIDFGKEEYIDKKYKLVYEPDGKNNTLTPESYVANRYYVIFNERYILCKDAQFNSEETYYADDSITTITNIPIKNIIMEGVHEYAKEPFENIIINDLDDYGLELLEYRGSQPMYLYIGDSDSNIGEVEHMTLNKNQKVYVDGITEAKISELAKYNPRITLDFSGAPEIDATVITMTPDTEEKKAPRFTIAKIEKGQTCGYRLTDITYAGDLIGGIGESMTSILDKIVNMLGNFEYFYDLDGHFRFQRKQTFLDKTWNPIVNEGSTDGYVDPAAYTSANVWNFEGNLLLSAINNNPSLTNLKNDYSLWGSRKTPTGKELPVHLRYAIDKKPTYYKNYAGEVFTTEEARRGEMKEQIRHYVEEKLKKEFYNFPRKANPQYPGKQQLSSDWWYMSDWFNYYKKLTGGQIPNGRIYNYATNNTGNPALPQGYVRDFNPNDYFETDNPTKTTDKIRMWLFHLQNDKYLYGTSSQHDGSADNDSIGSTGVISPFSGCTAYTYTDFVTLDENGNAIDNPNYTGFFYKPNFPEATKEVIDAAVDKYIKEHEEELIEELNAVCDWREIIYQMAKDYRKHNHDDEFLYNIRINSGLDSNGNWYYPTGYTGYEQYYIDLEGFWRQLYCPQHLVLTEGLPDIEYDKDGWNVQITKQPELLNFWFDFLDPYRVDGDADLGKFGIPTVGDRAKSVNDNAIKAIYFREVPTTLFTTDISTVDRKSGYTYIQYLESMHGLFNISSQGKSAKDELDNYLYKYAYCIENVSITSIPLYHLEPNTRIYVHDENSNINGQYIISKLTIPLQYNGTMSISATKAADRIY